MNKILKNRKALANVITTLIILVVSILLATVLTFYAINVTTNSTQQESLAMSNLHVWYCNYSGEAAFSQAAFVLINTGGKDVVLQSITARSQPIPWGYVFYNTTNTATIGGLGPYPENITASSSGHILPPIHATGNSSAIWVSPTSGPITLKSGWTLIVYIDHPDSVGMNDIGTPVQVTVFTANAQWTQVTNVQASP
jgi:hypothetical protein